MSGTSNGSITPKASAKPRFSSHIKELLEVSQKLNGFQKELISFDRLVDEKKQLEENLKLLTTTLTMRDQEISQVKATKDAEVAKIEAEKDILHREFLKKYLTWHTDTTERKELDANVVELEQQLSNMKKMVQSSNYEAAGLKQDLAESTELGQKKDKDLKDFKKAQDKLNRELKGTLSQLESLEKDQDALGLKDLSSKSLNSDLSKFAARCYGLAKHFFLAPLPKELGHDDLCMKLKQCGFAAWVPKRFVTSDSLSSQYLRTAAALKIITSNLCSNIFQPYYLPKSAADRQLMDTVLSKLERSSPYEEAVFRVRLVSAYKDEEADYINSVLKSVVIDISTLVDPLLTQSSRKNFQSEIKKLFKEAVELWLPTQRSRTKVFVDDRLDDEWEMYEEYDSAIEPNEELKKYTPMQGEPTDVLFPRVYFGSEVLLEGYALWSDQRAVVAASIEQTKNNAHPARRRTNSSNHDGASQEDSKSRKLNLSSSTVATGKQGDSPASPTSPRSSMMSFNDRISIRKAKN